MGKPKKAVGRENLIAQIEVGDSDEIIELEQKVIQFTVRLTYPDLYVPTGRIEPFAGKEPCIVWEHNGVNIRSYSSACFREFIRLSESTDAQIVAFSKKWGILGVQHKVDFWEARRGVWGVQPSRYWQIYARQMRGALFTARALFDDNEPSRELWGAVHQMERPEEFCWPDNYPLDQETQRERLAEVVSDLLRRADLYPKVSWEEREQPHLLLGGTADLQLGDLFPDLQNMVPNPGSPMEYFRRVMADPLKRTDRLLPNSLYRALVLNLVAAVTAPNRLRVCAICDEPFHTPQNERLLRHDRGAFCRDECRVEANRVQNKECKRKERAEAKNLEQN